MADVDKKTNETGSGTGSNDNNNDSSIEEAVPNSPHSSTEYSTGAAASEITPLRPGASTTQSLTPELSYFEAMQIILKLGVPTVLAYTFSYHLVVLAMMGGRIPDEENGGSHLGATVLSTAAMNMISVLSVTFFLALSGHMLAKDMDENKEETSGALKQAAYLSLPIMSAAIFPLVYSEEMLTLFGQDKENSALAATYLKTASLAIPAFITHVIVEQILGAFNQQVAGMKMAVPSFLIGALISYVLCFGKLGAPKLGFQGIAYGFVAEEYLTALMFCMYLHFNPAFKNHRFFKAFKTFTRDDFVQMKSILKSGSLVTLTFFSELTASFLLALFAGMQGKKELDIYNYCAQLTGFSLVPTYALGITAWQQVAGAISKERYLNARQFAKAGISASVLFASPIVLAIMINPNLLFDLFGKNSELDGSHDTVHIVGRITAAGVGTDAARYVALQLLRATGNNFNATMITSLSIWAGVGAAYLAGDLTLDIVAMVSTYEGIAIGAGAGILGKMCWDQLKIPQLKIVYEKAKAANDAAKHKSISVEDVVDNTTVSVVANVSGSTNSTPENVGSCISRSKRSNWPCCAIS